MSLATVLLSAFSMVACDRQQADPAGAPPAVQGPTEMPADHPALGEPPTATPRLAPTTVLANVGDDVITAGDVDTAIGAMPGPERLEYASPEMVQDLVELLVDRKLLAMARARGAEPQSLVDVAREPPGEAEITTYYREHAAEFTEPARVLVTRATAATEGAVEGLRRRLAGGATVAELQAAQAITADQVWLQDVPKKPDATGVALALRPGEVSRRLPVAGGFLVMRADQVVPARLRPMAEVRAGILASLEDAARQAAAAATRERLRKGVRVSIDEALIASYAAPAGDPSGAR
ncbi:MAG: peptidylprolyl isomerase [Gammaproteobacteria bacterium]